MIDNMKLHTLESHIATMSCTQAEAADELGVPRATLRAWVHRGLVQKAPLSRIPRTEVERLRRQRADADGTLDTGSADNDAAASR
jgi:hypothetical protein